jgi:hypothetical protein
MNKILKAIQVLYVAAELICTAVANDLSLVLNIHHIENRFKQMLYEWNLKGSDDGI